MDLFSKGSSELVIDCSSSDLKLVVGTYNPKSGSINIDKMGIVVLFLTHSVS